MINKNRVDQFTLTELDTLQDDKFLKHGKRKNELTDPKFVSIKGGRTAEFSIKSSDYDQNKKEYVIEMMFPALSEEYIREGLTAREIVDLAVGNGDVRVSCSCPAFLWWGYMYITTVLDSKYGIGTRIKPDIRNPQEKGVFCKHLGKTFDYLARDNFEFLKNKFIPVIEKNIEADLRRKDRERILKEDVKEFDQLEDGFLIEEADKETDIE